MNIWSITTKKYSLFLADTIFFLSALYFALCIRRFEFVSVEYFLSHLPTFSIIYITFITGMYIMNMYEVLYISNRLKKIKSILYVAVSSIFIGNTYFYIFHSDYTPKTVLIIQLLILSIFCILIRIINENKNKLKIAIISNEHYKKEIQENIKDSESLEILASVQNMINDSDRYADVNVMSTIKNSEISILVVDMYDKKYSRLLPHIYDLSKAGLKVMDINSFYEFLFKKTTLESVSYSWFFKEVKANTKVYELFKRAIDLILCAPVFIAWALIHPWVYFTIKNDDKGEVYSVQERLGKYNKKIFIKKYRTMSFTDKGAWLEGSVNKVTEVGKFLRKTRIDELPQIFSVIKGDLSFIGPRTDIVNLGDKLSSEISNYNLRYSVTPGLSGWAQVNMDYQPRSVEDTMERLRYDLYYVKHRSLILDFIIILKTIKTVLGREGS